jgi:hypothetical protein
VIEIGPNLSELILGLLFVLFIGYMIWLDTK